MGSPLAGFPPNKEIQFSDDFSEVTVLDITPFFLLIFSPLETADLLVLLELPGDGYSLLCSKKQPPRHNCTVLSGGQ